MNRYCPRPLKICIWHYIKWITIIIIITITIIMYRVQCRPTWLLPFCSWQWVPRRERRSFPWTSSARCRQASESLGSNVLLRRGTMRETWLASRSTGSLPSDSQGTRCSTETERVQPPTISSRAHTHTDSVHRQPWFYCKYSPRTHIPLSPMTHALPVQRQLTSQFSSIAFLWPVYQTKLLDDSSAVSEGEIQTHDLSI